MAKTGQLCYGGDKNVICRGDMRKTYFQHFLEDFGWYTKMESMYNGVDRWSQKEFYSKMIDYSADLVREKNGDFVKIKRLNLSAENEKLLWGNVFLKSLCTKVQAFNLKMVHGALSTMEVMGEKSYKFPNKWCCYCRNVLNINIVETDVHIFLECHIAKAVWHCINERLSAANLDNIVVNKFNLFYKVGMGKPQVHFISEVNWALWKNRCSNVYDETLNSHRAVMKIISYRLKLISKIDKVLLSIRVYNERWLGLNQAVEAINV